ANWQPLLPREAHRERDLLFGPPKWLACERHNQRLHLWATEIEAFDADPCTVNMLLATFQKISVVLVLVSIFRELGLSPSAVPRLTDLIHRFQTLEDHREPHCTALLLPALPATTSELFPPSAQISETMDIAQEDLIASQARLI